MQSPFIQAQHDELGLKLTAAERLEEHNELHNEASTGDDSTRLVYTFNYRRPIGITCKKQTHNIASSTGDK
jgi:hypothetical protein